MTVTTATAHALELKGVRVALAGRTIVEHVTISFAAGRVHAVIGRSGAGKSVLMKAAAGLLRLAAGRVVVHTPPLVFVHQDPALLDTLDVEENIAFAVERTPLARADVRARVDDAARALGLDSLRRSAVAALSTAQQKRVALARALALAPGVLIVDEPTTGLDPIAARQVDESLAALAGEQQAEGGGARTTLIVITHSPRTLARLAPRVVVVENHGARAA